MLLSIITIAIVVVALFMVKAALDGLKDASYSRLEADERFATGVNKALVSLESQIDQVNRQTWLLDEKINLINQELALPGAKLHPNRSDVVIGAKTEAELSNLGIDIIWWVNQDPQNDPVQYLCNAALTFGQDGPYIEGGHCYDWQSAVLDLLDQVKIEDVEDGWHGAVESVLQHHADKHQPLAEVSEGEVLDG